MAMLQTLVISFLLLLQSLYIPLFNAPLQGPVDYGGTPYVPTVIAAADELYLARDGLTEYTIVLPDGDVPLPDQQGVRWLQEFTGQMLGLAPGEKPFAEARESEAAGKCIYVGDTDASRAALADVIPKIGNEGFVKRVVGDDIYIYGVGRGTMYGCADFLEQELGCRWFAVELKYAPRTDDIIISKKLDNLQNPQLWMRDVGWNVVRNVEFKAFNKINASHNTDIPAEYGYDVGYIAGGWCHTLHHLVPRDLYATNPELFSWRIDQNQWTQDQRCLTNPEVFDITIASMCWYIDNDPKTYRTIFSVTQEDNNEYCQCANCQAKDRETGGPAGTNLWFTNKIAAEIERLYPEREIYIDTFAYGYTVEPPAKVVNGGYHPDVIPRANVIVRLCSIDACFLHPFTDCGHRDELLLIPRFKDVEKTFARQTEIWSYLCSINGAQLTVWDYTTNFKFYPSVYPNIQALAPNIKFLIEHGAVGIYEQGNAEGTGRNGEVAELRAWLLAKLLWNPDEDVDHLMTLFMNNYYGAAGPYIKEYWDYVTRIALNTKHLTCFGRVESNLYLTPIQVRNCDTLFDKAENAVSDSEYHLMNVRRTRVSFRCLKANYMMGEFSWLNPCRVSNSKELFHHIVMAGIDSISGPVVEPYSTYVWLHRPYDWGAMKSWIDFYDKDKIDNFLDTEAYRAEHTW